MSEGLIKISVRELVEFVLRQGSINANYMSSNRAVIGTLAHRKIQQSMEDNYEAEVRLVHECEMEGISFIVEGRADGIIRDLVSITVDEIKTTTTPLELIDENFNPLHWAQAKCYAYFIAKKQGLKEMQVQLTYYHIDDKEIKRLKRSFFYEELEVFFNQILKKYCRWVKFHMAWTKKRDASLRELDFPFDSYRKGQRELAVHVYKSIQNEENLYVSAPTGIGKTISTLFPSLKALGEGHGAKIFYLTAKTITRTIAEEACNKLYQRGAKIKSITLTAKDKICFCEHRVCHPDYCQWANGHYDRVDDAVYEMLQEEDVFTRAVIEDYAKKHQVCPFELSLDLAIWADVVICDYNYIFDPSVGLKRFLDNKDFILLVDEAHNLVDRAREMYSSLLSKQRILAAKRVIGKQYPTITKELGKVNEWLLNLRKTVMDEMGAYISKEAPKSLYMLLRRFLGACDKKLQNGGSNNLPQELMDLYFEVYGFSQMYELFDEHYVTYGESNGHEVTLKLFCLDPSLAIHNITKTCKSVIFFSATLLPIAYYKYMLGGQEDKAIAFNSPFDETHALRLIASDVSTRYRHREGSFYKICEYIDKLARAKTGHYMVFFPSYKYMLDVYDYFITCYHHTDETDQTLGYSVYNEDEEHLYTLHKQEGDMSEEEREAFLGQFVPNPQATTIHFCVLGGIFSEGIDLAGDRLIGVIVVGVGLPQLSLERDLIKHYFDDQEKEGYHYAYTYPGVNKVLQAVGRLIRSEEDRGVILLIDDRFNTPLYQSLLSPEFALAKRGQLGEVGVWIRDFWK